MIPACRRVTNTLGRYPGLDGAPVATENHTMMNSIKKWLSIGLKSLCSSLQSRLELAIENLALRQQLAVYNEKRPKPQLTAADRVFWALLRKISMDWAKNSEKQPRWVDEWLEYVEVRYGNRGKP